MTGCLRFFTVLVFAVLLVFVPVSAQRTLDLDAATIADINAAFEKGTLTSEHLVQMFLARIDAYDRKGPTLRAVLTINQHALETARALDAERKTKGRRSPLHGIPVVIKDNIDTADMPTTGGSVMLEGWVPPDDAFVVQKLRAAGAVIIAQDEFVGVRVGRDAQFAGRPDSESSRPGAFALGFVGRHGRVTRGGVCHGRTRHRHRRVGARSVDQQRHCRFEDDDGTREP